MARVDPCSCTHECPHGGTCMGGHANYPDWHWYQCETCTPSDATYVRDGDGWLGTCRRCGFTFTESALAPGRDRMTDHIRECRKAESREAIDVRTRR